MNFSSELLDGDELLNGRETKSIFQMSRNYFSLIVVARSIKPRIQNAQIVCFHYFSSWLQEEKKTKIGGSVEQQSFTALSYPSTPTSTVLLIIMCQRRRCEKNFKTSPDWMGAAIRRCEGGLQQETCLSTIKPSFPLSRTFCGSIFGAPFYGRTFASFSFCVCHLTHSELVEKEKPAEHPNNNFRKRLSGKFPISRFHINCQLINYLHSRKVTNCSCIACLLNYAAWLGAALCPVS